MNTAQKLTSIALVLVLASACGLNGVVEDSRGPEDIIKYGDASTGKLFGDINLWGGEEKNSEGQNGFAVNALVWSATLDVLSFLPLVSADPFSGIIITDWYSEAGYDDERFKVNAFIQGGELRADSIKLSVFKQKKGASGDWLSFDFGEESARKLEDTILLKARELRVKNNNKYN